MQFKKWVEAYEDWQGDWKHVSKVPFIKINYKPYHQDPLGVYLFPADFKPIAVWKRLPYEISVEVAKDLRVLDLSRLSPQDCVQLVRRLGITEQSAFEDEILKRDGGHQDSMWEWIKQAFSFNNARMNSAFRKAGYEAIFDDIGAIHNSEKQLVVLDPTKIHVKKVDRRKGSGYKELVQVVDAMKDALSQFGEVQVDKPKKGQYSGWDRQTKIATRVVVTKGDRDISWTVETHNTDPDTTPVPDRISVRYSWSKPYLDQASNASIGAGVEMDDMDMSELIRVITDATRKVWDAPVE